MNSVGVTVRLTPLGGVLPGENEEARSKPYGVRGRPAHREGGVIDHARGPALRIGGLCAGSTGRGRSEREVCWGCQDK
ncbi:hypothetical protein FHR32_004738 [Streptosporangium album]|uniref:Uncharacterized protein n=1 Tax=Streptosporangium album TaxID=47479 RepID=A0A7W7RZF7_9ACTN|nr:hypothetical protein [Streptosporangium album]